MSRNYPLKRIRYWYAYDIDEVCALYKDTRLHPQTVLGWIKNGLPTADGVKPFLIMGHQLTEFLGNRNKTQKHKTQIHEIFCRPCRDIKTPYKKQVQITKHGYLHNMKAICPDCKRIMNKGISLEHYPAIKKFYAVVDVLQLYDCEVAPVTTHLPAQVPAQHSEPVQGELF
jgi:hypothetical protein